VELVAGDSELVQRAQDLVDERGDRDRHSVAAAIRDRDGRVVAALNVYHFTGGPCAELVALGVAVSEGLGELDNIVAVADEGRGVLGPCGRCRQVLFDYCPDLRVIVPTGPDHLESIAIADVLPHANRWTEATGSMPN